MHDTWFIGKREKADLIDRIKETRAATEEPTSIEEATIKGISVEETAQVEEAASVEEETSVLKDSPVEENAEKVSGKTTDGLSDSGETTNGLIAKLETATDALAVDIEGTMTLQSSKDEMLSFFKSKLSGETTDEVGPSGTVVTGEVGSSGTVITGEVGPSGTVVTG